MLVFFGLSQKPMSDEGQTFCPGRKNIAGALGGGADRVFLRPTFLA